MTTRFGYACLNTTLCAQKPKVCSDQECVTYTENISIKKVK